MARHELPGQQSFDFSCNPFNCPYESAVVDIGGGKSFCDLWQRWTNCREVGHCVYERNGDNPMTVTRDSYQAAFSKRLKQTIQAKDMKYLEVANKADVGLNAVSKWANGAALPTVFTFAKICVAMKLDAHTICALLGVNAK